MAGFLIGRRAFTHRKHYVIPEAESEVMLVGIKELLETTGNDRTSRQTWTWLFLLIPTKESSLPTLQKLGLHDFEKRSFCCSKPQNLWWCFTTVTGNVYMLANLPLSPPAPLLSMFNKYITFIFLIDSHSEIFSDPHFHQVYVLYNQFNKTTEASANALVYVSKWKHLANGCLNY